MENNTLNERRSALRTDLVASARVRADGMVIYSEEGTPMQNQELLPYEVKTQLLCSGAFSENADKFVSDLETTGVAKIRQARLMTSFTAA